MISTISSRMTTTRRPMATFLLLCLGASVQVLSLRTEDPLSKNRFVAQSTSNCVNMCTAMGKTTDLDCSALAVNYATVVSSMSICRAIDGGCSTCSSSEQSSYNTYSTFFDDNNCWGGSIRLSPSRDYQSLTSRNEWIRTTQVTRCNCNVLRGCNDTLALQSELKSTQDAYDSDLKLYRGLLVACIVGGLLVGWILTTLYHKWTQKNRPVAQSEAKGVESVPLQSMPSSSNLQHQSPPPVSPRPSIQSFPPQWQGNSASGPQPSFQSGSPSSQPSMYQVGPTQWQAGPQPMYQGGPSQWQGGPQFMAQTAPYPNQS